MNPLRIAVIGAGHLGRIHARLLNQVPNVQLVGVVDTLASARASVAAEANTLALASLSDAPEKLDAVVIATPTRTHRQVALECIDQGLHVFVEKPMALGVAEADEMNAAAEQANVTLQVGHVERFNPAIRAAAPHLTSPRLIESVRESGYTFRSTDIGVVHDLMIHDIDLALWLTQSRVAELSATGLTVVGPHEDLAHARLTMENGCVVVLKASRISQQPQRACRVYAESGYADINFADGTTTVMRPGQMLLERETAIQQATPTERNRLRDEFFESVLPTVNVDVQPGNAILQELEEFTNCIRTGERPSVCGAAGRHAVEVADQIIQAIQRDAWDARDRVVAEQFQTGHAGHQDQASSSLHRKAG
ncbi:MAG TPA: gfo/Idh/MocA family oxidoreductase [Planctomycetaceae bacterium]|nr:gfo/Idh/MocA family oxidoreductase [Planctomycetaceae bacterium]